MSELEGIYKKVELALNDIRPYLETDGGNVKVLEISDDFIVKLELMGACSHCPMSIMTMKAGIEESIKRHVPEIAGVEAVNLTSYDDPHAKLPGNLT